MSVHCPEMVFTNSGIAFMIGRNMQMLIVACWQAVVYQYSMVFAKPIPHPDVCVAFQSGSDRDPGRSIASSVRTTLVGNGLESGPIFAMQADNFLRSVLCWRVPDTCQNVRFIRNQNLANCL